MAPTFFSESDLVLRHLSAVHSVGAVSFPYESAPTSFFPLLSTPFPTRAVPSFLRSVEIGKTAQRSPATPTSTSFVDECRGRRCAVPPLPPTLSAVISAGQSRFGAQEGGQEFRGAFVAWRQTVDAIEGLCTEMDAAVKGGGFCMGRLSQSSRVRFPDCRV